MTIRVWQLVFIWLNALPVLANVHDRIEATLIDHAFERVPSLAGVSALQQQTKVDKPRK
jgi:hypothetical protein